MDSIFCHGEKANLCDRKALKQKIETRGSFDLTVTLRRSSEIRCDVTVICPFTQSYVTKYSIPGAAAELAASQKSDKYANLANSYLFQPIALENLGAINESATSLISELRRKVTVKSNDPRDSIFCFSAFLSLFSALTQYFCERVSLWRIRTSNHSDIICINFYALWKHNTKGKNKIIINSSYRIICHPW